MTNSDEDQRWKPNVEYTEKENVKERNWNDRNKLVTDLWLRETIDWNKIRQYNNEQFKDNCKRKWRGIKTCKWFEMELLCNDEDGCWDCRNWKIIYNKYFKNRRE